MEIYKAQSLISKETAKSLLERMGKSPVDMEEVTSKDFIHGVIGTLAFLSCEESDETYGLPIEQHLLNSYLGLIKVKTDQAKAAALVFHLDEKNPIEILKEVLKKISESDDEEDELEIDVETSIDLDDLLEHFSD